MTTGPPMPARPPWTLSVPASSSPQIPTNVQDSINARRLYRLSGAAPTWSVEPGEDPSPYLVSLDWRLTKAGLLGSDAALRTHISTWPASGPDTAAARAYLTALQAMPKPVTPLDLAEANRLADLAIGFAESADLPELAAKIATHLLQWYPGGQMVAIGKGYEYIMSGRPVHMLAAATLNGWDSVQESLKAGRGGLWFHGEDISGAHPGALYLGLVNGIDLPGAAYEVPPVIFIFEFGEYLRMPALDYVSLRHLHSLPVLDYLPPNIPAQSGIVQPGLLEQDALRAWFLAGFNRLADHILRWQNFMTRAGQLQPVTQQQDSMSIGRILYVSGHFLASEERGARLADFWQLVDLYAGLQGGGIPRLFSRKYWEEVVITALSTLPGGLAKLFQDYATELYAEWVEQSVAGVIPPSRVTSAGVAVPYQKSPRTLSPEAFLAAHLQERRDTLHGYDLQDPVKAALLAIHNGSLPVRLPEWGRLMLFALLSDPVRIVERRFL